MGTQDQRKILKSTFLNSSKFKDVTTHTFTSSTACGTLLRAATHASSVCGSFSLTGTVGSGGGDGAATCYFHRDTIPIPGLPRTPPVLAPDS
jgi:hypothetical protein